MPGCHKPRLPQEMYGLPPTLPPSPQTSLSLLGCSSADSSMESSPSIFSLDTSQAPSAVMRHHLPACSYPPKTQSPPVCNASISMLHVQTQLPTAGLYLDVLEATAHLHLKPNSGLNPKHVLFLSARGKRGSAQEVPVKSTGAGVTPARVQSRAR